MLILRCGDGGGEDGHGRQPSDDEMPRKTHDVVTQRRADDYLDDDEAESDDRKNRRPRALRTRARGHASPTAVRKRQAGQRCDGRVSCRAKWRERSISEPPQRRGCRQQQETPRAPHFPGIFELSDRNNRHGHATDQVRHHQNRRHAAEDMWSADQARHQAAGQYQQQPAGDRPRPAELLMI